MLNIRTPITILASPAATILTDREGSVNSIGYNLIRKLSEGYNIRFHAIVNDIAIKKQFDDNVKLYRIGIKKMSLVSLSFALRSFECSREVISNNKPSIVHHFGPFAYGTGFNFLTVFGGLENLPFIIGPAEVPHVFNVDDFAAMGYRKINRTVKAEYLITNLMRKVIDVPLWYLFKTTIDRCDILIAVNEETKKLFSRAMDSDKIRVVPLGVDVNEFKFSKLLDNHDILTAGVHIKRKGFDYLIQSMPQIIEEFPDAKLHLLSDGPRRQTLESLAEGLGIKENVNFHGSVPREKVIEMFKNCRVFCHPSLSEGFCHVTLEAMAAGRPVVTTTTVGADGLVEEGVTGFNVPPANSNALASALIKILGDYELACKMGAAARKKAELEYDWNVIAKKYYEVYLEALDDKNEQV